MSEKLSLFLTLFKRRLTSASKVGDAKCKAISSNRDAYPAKPNVYSGLVEDENRRLKKMYAEERLIAELRKEALEGK